MKRYRIIDATEYNERRLDISQRMNDYLADREGVFPTHKELTLVTDLIIDFIPELKGFRDN